MKIISLKSNTPSNPFIENIGINNKKAFDTQFIPSNKE
jgi:hypothetical protein